MSNEIKDRKIRKVIKDVLNQKTPHSVNKDNAIATQFYIVEEIQASGKVKLLLSDEHYSEGDISKSSFYSNSKTEETQILSGPYDCPPMPHVLALEAWVSDVGLDEYFCKS